MRAKSKKIPNPALHFAGWHYRIDPHHHETLGVTLREFVLNKKPYNAYAIQDPPDYQFSQGYTFYTDGTPKKFLQIAAELDPFTVEVHEGWAGQQPARVMGYAVPIAELAQWLQTGVRPTHCKPVDMAASKGGLMAWQLLATDQGNA